MGTVPCEEGAKRVTVDPAVTKRPSTVQLLASAADDGRLSGLSAQTIYSYERGKPKPRAAQLAKLVAVRDLGKREAKRRLALLKG